MIVWRLGLYLNATGVFLSLRGDIIPSHGYVVIDDIGSTGNTALFCNTNRKYNSSHSGGDWYGPDENVSGFRKKRSSQTVRLLRNIATDPPSEGIYHCLIEDVAMTEQTVFVGLYTRRRGVSI